MISSLYFQWPSSCAWRRPVLPHEHVIDGEPGTSGRTAAWLEGLSSFGRNLNQLIIYVLPTHSKLLPSAGCEFISLFSIAVRGIRMKKGVFSPQEDVTIRANWARVTAHVDAATRARYLSQPSTVVNGVSVCSEICWCKERRNRHARTKGWCWWGHNSFEKTIL